MRNFKKKHRIGDLLLQYGIINEEQLQSMRNIRYNAGRHVINDTTTVEEMMRVAYGND